MKCLAMTYILSYAPFISYNSSWVVYLKIDSYTEYFRKDR